MLVHSMFLAKVDAGGGIVFRTPSISSENLLNAFFNILHFQHLSGVACP